MSKPQSARVARKRAISGARSAIVYAPVSSLVSDPLNPRTHNRQQVRAIARSIEAFGFNAPILVARGDRIVAGHGRLEAAKSLGLADVPIIRLEHLSEPQAKAYMLADNRLSDRSSWEDGQLALRLKELHEIALDFEIESTGFELPEIDLRIQSLEPPDAADEADEFEPPQGTAVSRVGDVWRLGRHRLVCGSALEPLTYEATLEGELAAAVFADPPYNVPINGHAGGRGRKKHHEFPMASGELDRTQFADFLSTALQQTRSHADKSAVYFMCMDWRHIAETATAIDRAQCELINLCVWVKSNGGMGSLYRSRHELVFVFRERGAKYQNNVQLGVFGRNRTNVWHFPGMNGFTQRGRTRGLDIHPTVKPVAMVAEALLDVTHHGDIVLDPFCGSGTTILAAERTGRCGRGIELDPIYVDLTIARWQRMTRLVAVHASGQTYEQVRTERVAPMTSTALVPVSGR
jgi:DNA modification methylase